MISDGGTIPLPVSTHSRLKAAGHTIGMLYNTLSRFQHTAA